MQIEQEAYGLDSLQRILAFNRGTLAGGDASLSSLTLEQGWKLDATGNWSDFRNFDLLTPANSLVQQRTSNMANEIVDIAATVATAWTTPVYDRNGNMTTIPLPTPSAPTTSAAGVVDAWNRLVALTGTATYSYDGLHRRVYSLTSGAHPYRFFIHGSQWQVLEEYNETLSVPDRQYVWGIRYVDDLVLRDRSNSGTLNERFYALQDANWNVVAIYNNSTNAIDERYAYTAYGVCQFLNPTTYGILSGSSYDWTILFTGRTLDDESGLYYYRMRYYHPALGAFVSREPAQVGLNTYSYCGSRPLERIDPTGEQDRWSGENNFCGNDRGGSRAERQRRFIADVEFWTERVGDRSRWDRRADELRAEEDRERATVHWKYYLPSHYTHDDYHGQVTCDSTDTCEETIAKLQTWITNGAIRTDHLHGYLVAAFCNGALTWEQYKSHIDQLRNTNRQIGKCWVIAKAKCGPPGRQIAKSFEWKIPGGVPRAPTSVPWWVPSDPRNDKYQDLGIAAGIVLTVVGGWLALGGIGGGGATVIPFASGGAQAGAAAAAEGALLVPMSEGNE